MRIDTRLSLALHALLHMAEEASPITSADLADRMHTDASVIRRTLSGLRDLKYIRSDKGHGGGWMLCTDLKKLTLLDVYKAVGSPTLFAFGVKDEKSKCLVEKAVNSALDNALSEAETVLLERFQSITIEQLSSNFACSYRKHVRKQSRAESLQG